MYINNWKDLFAKESQLPYFKRIIRYILYRKSLGLKIYPPFNEMLNAFYYTELQNVKVVILGQDPYSYPRQAHGLSFSVKIGSPIPPSLMNIYKELKNDIFNFYIPKHGCLLNWAKQGVLLLNCILTVEEGNPNSHSNIGWEILTDKIIKIISLKKNKIVFLLWGNFAKRKINLIDIKKHLVLKTSHPSPWSAHMGFIGCRHFSKTNAFLSENKKKIINWQI